MYLGDIWIALAEVERIAWRESRLRLDLRWTWEEIPVLLGLEAPILLRWHTDDPEAGLPMELLGWRFLTDRNTLRLLFRC